MLLFSTILFKALPDLSENFTLITVVSLPFTCEVCSHFCSSFDFLYRGIDVYDSVDGVE